MISKTVGVILAGGSGTRYGASIPKQFLTFAGKTVLEHSVSVFEDFSEIDEIAIVSKAEFIPKVEELVRKNNWRKVKRILRGGTERYHSTIAAVEVYEDEDILLFHDAVRPLLSQRILNDCIEALKVYNAVDVAIQTTDTIIQVDDSGCISKVPSRKYLMNGQTPQCFKRKILKEAYVKALADPSFNTTDDCGTVVRYLPSEKVFVVEGEVANMKITYKEDLSIIEKIYNAKTKLEGSLSSNK